MSSEAMRFFGRACIPFCTMNRIWLALGIATFFRAVFTSYICKFLVVARRRPLSRGIDSGVTQISGTASARTKLHLAITTGENVQERARIELVRQREIRGEGCDSIFTGANRAHRD